MQSVGAGLVSSDGLEFVGETPGAFAVAAPGTWTTLVVGLAFLGGVTHRNWHQQATRDGHT